MAQDNSRRSDFSAHLRQLETINRELGELQIEAREPKFCGAVAEISQEIATLRERRARFIRDIELEGYEVLVDADGRLSVRPR